ncbi:MAG: glycosyltransferase family 2 protein [Reichenbachiella sp.]
MHQINILVPLYNEEQVFEELTKRLISVVSESNLSISIILIDDGSKDNTPRLMEELSMKDSRFQSVFLSRNFGHQLCLTAGMAQVDATEAVFIIDGDLQDPPELLGKFYEEMQKGYDVIYGIRATRKEGPLKKLAYKSFYILLRKISYFDIPLDSGDFSLVSRRVIDQIVLMKEESRFLRGMRSWIGFKQKGVAYDRADRKFGNPKYSFRMLIQLALNGIFNFSEAPIKFITKLGLSTVFISSFFLIYTLYARLVLDQVPEGFTSLIFVIILFGGVQLISIGLIGEYILRIYFQVKDRPLFIVDKVIKNRQVNGK